jgi:glycosyl transferase family 25
MFDKILYINLAHRQDRKNNVIKELSKINMLDKAIRIDAVNGKNLDLKNISPHLITKKGINDALNENQKVYTYLTPGAIGCALSHKKAYEYIINNNLSSALIIEDDILIDKNFKSRLSIIYSKVPKDFDILFIGYHNTSDKYLERIDSMYSQPYKLYGLFGYIVTLEGAKKLLNIFPITEQIDSDIPKHFDNIRAYAVNPYKKIIFSDQSSVYTKFGTDIQVRETAQSKDNYNIRVLRFAIITLIIFLIFQIFMICYNL